MCICITRQRSAYKYAVSGLRRLASPCLRNTVYGRQGDTEIEILEGSAFLCERYHIAVASGMLEYSTKIIRG